MMPEPTLDPDLPRGRSAPARDRSRNRAGSPNCVERLGGTGHDTSDATPGMDSHRRSMAWHLAAPPRTKKLFGVHKRVAQPALAHPTPDHRARNWRSFVPQNSASIAYVCEKDNPSPGDSINQLPRHCKSDRRGGCSRCFRHARLCHLEAALPVIPSRSEGSPRRFLYVALKGNAGEILRLRPQDDKKWAPLREKNPLRPDLPELLMALVVAAVFGAAFGDQDHVFDVKAFSGGTCRADLDHHDHSGQDRLMNPRIDLR